MGVRLVVHNFLIDEMDYTGTHNHDDLLHRDSVDQHPIYAITGLQEVLNTIETNLFNISNAILTKSAEVEANANDYTDTKISEVNTVINNLNVINNAIDTDSINFTYNSEDKSLKANVIIYDDHSDTNSLVSTRDGLYVPKIVTRNTNTITWDSISGDESLREIFDNGIKFSHNNTNNNLYNPNEANAWYWDNTVNSFMQSQDTVTYNGFITQDFYDQYKHTARLVSTNSDGGINGIIIGFIFDENNNPHTLSAIIQKDINFGNYTFAVFYNYCLPGQVLIDNYNLINTSIHWSDGNITLYITKASNIITVSATKWNYNNQLSNIIDAQNIPFEYTFNINLDNYSFGYLFDKKVRYGYSNKSQADSYFDHIFFYSTEKTSTQDISANVRISNNINNAIETSQNGLFVKKFLLSQRAENGLLLLEDGYYVRNSSMQILNERQNGLIKNEDDFYYVHKSHSFIEVEQINHGFIVGDFIYYDTRSDKYQKASAIDDLNINVIGMVSYVTDENNFEYVCSGFVETDIFNTEHDYVQGMPLYISDTEPGKVTQDQPNISKAVGYPVGEVGVIISIERGIQYNAEASIGDFKTSANDYNIRSDGFIKVKDGVKYKLNIVQKLVAILDERFLDKYANIDNSDNTFAFKNSTQLYETQKVKAGLNLFIKAF